MVGVIVALSVTLEVTALIALFLVNDSNSVVDAASGVVDERDLDKVVKVEAEAGRSVQVDQAVKADFVIGPLLSSGHISRPHGSTEQQPWNLLAQEYQAVCFEHVVSAILI
jgi:hypothetical protein